MRIPQSYIQKCKVVAHVLQVLLIFIAACITIAVMTKDGTTGGATKYFFALCFVTIPALIYLTMVPMWSRAQRFANAFAFVALDALYCILWFAAFISIAMWNAQGIREGAKAKKKKESDGDCSTFKFGPEDKCNLSRATVGFGVVIFILFGITTAISSYYLIKFRKEGVLPYESAKQNPHHASGESAQKDNAWSTEMGGPHDGHDSDDDDRHTERGGNQEEDEYALLHSTETDEGRHPGRPLSWGDDRFGREQQHNAPPAPPYGAYNDADALSPGGYEEYRRDTNTPQGGNVNPAYGQRYDQDTSYGGGAGGQGYSFSGGDKV